MFKAKKLTTLFVGISIAATFVPCLQAGKGQKGMRPKISLTSIAHEVTLLISAYTGFSALALTCAAIEKMGFIDMGAGILIASLSITSLLSAFLSYKLYKKNYTDFGLRGKEKF